jgi:hypothetical protein
MKIQKARRLSKTDYPDVPDWMDPIFQVLNSFFERIVALVQNNITFTDNHLAEKRTFEVQDDTQIAIRLQTMKSKPTGVIVLDPGSFEYYKFTWEPSPTREFTINFKIKYDSTPASNPTVTILIVGG